MICSVVWYKIRINPGNIGGDENVKAVAEACRKRNIPIRIGVNAGSLEKRLLAKYGHPTPEAMVESARGHIKLLNRFDFDDICLSMKASRVPLTVAAYRLASEEFNYPLHLGVTETGTAWNGTIQSAVGIGTLLCEGIGNTIRVSLTADPVEEVKTDHVVIATGAHYVAPEIPGIDSADVVTAEDVLTGKVEPKGEVVILGGGGHAAAAGASVPGGIAGAKAAILRALAESGVRL